MKGAQGTFENRFGRLYIDPQADLGFQVNIPGATRSSYRGNGNSNGWTSDSSLDSSWTGAATAGAAAPTGDSYDLILIANDSGNLNQWGINGLTAAEVAKITLPNKPVKC